MIALRWLTGIYLTCGLLCVVFAAILLGWGVSDLISREPRKATRGSETVIVSLLTMTGTAPVWLAAIGLKRRWRYARYVLIGVSAWSILAGGFGVLASLATMAGLVNGEQFGIEGSPFTNFLIGLTLIAFSAWQWWVLWKPEVRQAFLDQAATRRNSPTDLAE